MTARAAGDPRRGSGSALQRRLVTVPAVLLAWFVWLGSAPLWIPTAAVVDLVRRRGTIALRSGAMLAFYLSCEVVGLVASAGLYAWKACLRVDEERWQDLHFRLEAWWGASLFRALVVLLGLRVEVTGSAALDRGPVLLLMRHASTADTLLASALISRPHGLRLRYVLKRELLWDPCLDIVGHRIPNVFVDRFSGDSEVEVRRVAALARGLGPRDGVLIYPEGTRFSEAKRRRVLEGFDRRGDAKMLEYARSLVHVLPPRTGGTLALLDEAPDADVLIGAHTGLEVATSPTALWNGTLLHRTIRVHFERVPRERIPAGRDARAAWLRERWERVDEWVALDLDRRASMAPELR